LGNGDWGLRTGDWGQGDKEDKGDRGDRGTRKVPNLILSPCDKIAQ